MRAFADARAIIALAGASLTNLAFTRENVPVVGVSKQEIYGLNFVELSVALGQKHRWLVGENHPLDMLTGHVSSAYYLDGDAIADAVAWCVSESE